jgi:hypothetical protein
MRDEIKITVSIEPSYAEQTKAIITQDLPDSHKLVTVMLENTKVTKPLMDWLEEYSGTPLNEDHIDNLNNLRHDVHAELSERDINSSRNLVQELYRGLHRIDGDDKWMLLTDWY